VNHFSLTTENLKKGLIGRQTK